MIFKGNTKLTPALTDLLNDDTPLSDRTYSSEKIQSLLKTDAVTPFFKITKDEIAQLIPTNLPNWNTTNIPRNYTFFNNLNISNFTKITDVPSTDYDKYTFIAVCDTLTSSSVISSMTKANTNTAIFYVRFGSSITHMQFFVYGDTEVNIYSFYGGCVVGLNNKFINGETNLSYYMTWSPLTNFTPTITLNREAIINNLTDVTIYGFPKGSI